MPSSVEDEEKKKKKKNKSQQKKRTGGVADYFAVLGVGETLVWKHAQKQQQQQQQQSEGGGSTASSNAANEDAVAKKQEEEEECALVERFYREIVEVKIVVGGDDDDGMDHNDGATAAAASAADGKEKLKASDDVEGVKGTDCAQDGDDASSLAAAGTTATSIPQNPSDVTSVFSTDEDAIVSSTKRLVSNSNNSKEREVMTTTPGGYTVVKRTIPAGRSSAASPDDSPYLTTTTMTNAHELADYSLRGEVGKGGAANNGMNNDDTIWSKSQTFDADLNPVWGLRGTLLSSVSFPPPPPHATGDDDDENDKGGDYGGGDHGDRGDILKSDSTLTGSSSHSVTASATGAAANLAAKAPRIARGLGKKVSSRLRGGRQFIGPMLSGSSSTTGEIGRVGSNIMGLRRDNSAAVGTEGRTSDHQCAATYYLAYRRRGADETDVPAIAEVSLWYVRIHPYTVAGRSPAMEGGAGMEKSNTFVVGAASDSGSGHAATVISKNGANDGAHSSDNGQNSSSNSSLGMSREAAVAAASAAALKRGLVTGAGIAARVAVSGASRLMRSSNRGGAGGEIPQQQPTDSSNAFGGEDKNAWIISSRPSAEDPTVTTRRKHFFSDDDSFSDGVGNKGAMTGQSFSPSKARGHNNQLSQFKTIPLENLIELPDGFDAWSIPEMYKTLRLPTICSASDETGTYHPPGNETAEESSTAKHDNSIPPNTINPIVSSGSNNTAPNEIDEIERQRAAVEEEEERELRQSQRRMRKTFLFPHGGGLFGSTRAESPNNSDCSSAPSEPSGMGVEAYVDGNSFLRPSPSPVSGEISAANSSPEKLSRIWSRLSPQQLQQEGIRDLHNFRWEESDPSMYLPVLVDGESLPLSNRDGLGRRRHRQYGGTDPYRTESGVLHNIEYEYVPVIAIRRQRVSEEERFHEDPAAVDFCISFLDGRGNPVLPGDEDDDDSGDEEEEAGGVLSLLGKSKWCASLLPCTHHPANMETKKDTNKTVLPHHARSWLGMPKIFARHNTPLGFADAPFATSVIGRFPTKDYKGLPLPEEELPMFCYPTGCRLHRAKFQDAPLAEYYGFVVKNERGDSIFISCVSFMEPLTNAKLEQLNRMSERRKRVLLPHRRFCESRKQNTNKNDGKESLLLNDSLLTGFDSVVTYENKTICLISRYPHWTAFRRFLSHLHVLSGSSSGLPLERYISHLLLTVPVPKPGGQCVIVPLQTLSEPMALAMPPAKDLPLVDLPFQRLLACLDIPTIITVVLGFLALERKVIVMSTHPSLVLDGCELLRSLLFPFELCAPYVPRLTQPFMRTLEFPGAIFVGIHDDGCSDGLAAMVKKNLPEDSAIIDLDTGEIECSGDTYEILKQCWNLIPASPRSHLVAEIDKICRDAGVVPGQEPIDSLVDSAFDASLPKTLVEDFDDQGHRTEEPLDDRALRDAFLRFFTAILGGYERFLVVPDMDYLISGNEWFDTQKFLAAAPQDFSSYLGSFVATQLFQSFIQRRTEASDVHCMLFDECLAEFHSNSSSVPYGRLGCDKETIAILNGDENQRPYDLLVDQCATEVHYDLKDLMDADERTRGISAASCDESDTETNISQGLEYSVHGGRVSTEASFASTIRTDNGFAINNSGDLVTVPSRENIPEKMRYVYCVDGNPCFPHSFDPDLFFPKEPESLSAELAEISAPVLTRSDRELDEAARRKKMATSYRGLHNQRRCLWQLPKIMGSHFLGAWLMCIPFQVSQPQLLPEQQAKYLLRALGALRLLRSRQRIVPDEAAYRALMVACGRAGSDRRVEIVKLFGLLRSDGIFPSAVTLGQYTRAIAEGFSKRSSGSPDDGFDSGSMEVTASTIKAVNNLAPVEDNITKMNQELALNRLDRNLFALEESGRRWRQRQNREESNNNKMQADIDVEKPGTADKIGTQANPTRKTRRHNKYWLPVSCSSSYLPLTQQNSSPKRSGKVPLNTTEQKNCLEENNIKFVSLWSRVSSCETCFYVPLDEEIQSGWDIMGSEQTGPSAISCPRCGSMIMPLLGYKEMTLKEALQEERKATEIKTENHIINDQTITTESLKKKTVTNLNADFLMEQHEPSHTTSEQLHDADFFSLPPQLRPHIELGLHQERIGNFVNDCRQRPPGGESLGGKEGFVAYLSPSSMRLSLEKLVDEHGERVLERETLRNLDPRLFYNLWWFSARFSLPLPLAITSSLDDSLADEEMKDASKAPRSKELHHFCAFAGWDYRVAIQGCKSGAKAVQMLLDSSLKNKKHTERHHSEEMADSNDVSLDDFPLLSHFNLQAFAQRDWDHPDLSNILVALVEACDKRDFRSVVDCVLRCNAKRREKFCNKQVDCSKSDISADDSNGTTGTNLAQLAELDCYRTMLYLARYQCTTAFHTFFPATSKPCKGYHFWCATGTPLPIFDRMFRDAVTRIRNKDGVITPLHDISDVSLGFRCVFGHII